MASPRLVGESDFPEGVLLRRFPSRIPIVRQGVGWSEFGARILPRPWEAFVQTVVEFETQRTGISPVKNFTQP